MSLPFVRLSTVGDFEVLDGHEDRSEEILEEKLRQIQLSTLKAKKRLRKNFDNVKRHQNVSLPVRVQNSAWAQRSFNIWWNFSWERFPGMRLCRTWVFCPVIGFGFRATRPIVNFLILGDYSGKFRENSSEAENLERTYYTVLHNIYRFWLLRQTNFWKVIQGNLLKLNLVLDEFSGTCQHELIEFR